LNAQIARVKFGYFCTSKMKPFLKHPLPQCGASTDPAALERATLPQPEVIEGDPETGWGMWAEAVTFRESQSPESYADTMPSQLAPLLEPAIPIAMKPLAVESSESTPDRKKREAMELLARDHKRIHDAIELMWGRRECSAYIQKLMMSGGDGMGRSREGFKVEAVAAMLVLSDLNDAASEWRLRGA